ncbi:putative fatty acyl-CoA reductase CG5065 [Odontomachus brunneus]|uniref:putative fatty acyl-CoA reductase CG5065 n=1 Tax=Odontomachus brunneus TaxID=486640 RepID=UPI0013F1A8E5|nr:putative fatty acyl-CoA reductase CG5065 [Odontomachus brunneus]XP_032668394.1 putative fatty acyl-CoA reductase CG5065 [Odontomachus brunneus]
MTFQSTTMNKPTTTIQSFYKGKTIFITGASGFMGKVLLEKLLYSCSDLDKIYILIRPKKGHNIESRIDNMFKLPMFHRICQEKRHVLKKVLPLNGDLTMYNLGLTDEQRKTLMNEVHIVFHFAASLRLEAKLKDSVEFNTIGTRKVLDLARQIKHLQVFVHLSTAFCLVEQERVDEIAYDAPHDPNDIMRLVEWMDESAIDLLTPKLLGPFPNTYIYTKRLAETLVTREYPNLPCVIARPSIVIPAMAEPLPGWVDNLNGPTGIIVAASKGVLRTMLCNTQYQAEVIPVDIVINFLINISHKVATQQKPKSIPVYNAVNNDHVHVTWGDILKISKSICYEYPFEGQAWYPGGNVHTNKFIHYLLVFFFHIIPAYLIDFLMLIFLQKRFMVRIQKRISTGLEVLQYFTMRNWVFDNTKLEIIREESSPEDKKIFPLVFSMNIREYMKIVILGTRQYCMKESLSSLPKARRHQATMYVVHLLTKFLFYFGILFFIYKNSEMVRYCLHLPSL